MTTVVDKRVYENDSNLHDIKTQISRSDKTHADRGPLDKPIKVQTWNMRSVGVNTRVLLCCANYARTRNSLPNRRRVARSRRVVRMDWVGLGSYGIYVIIRIGYANEPILMSGMKELPKAAHQPALTFN